jgi:hypothetical protein
VILQSSADGTQMFQHEFAHLHRPTLLPNPTDSLPTMGGHRHRGLPLPHVILSR